jgi:hypothetical protein
MEKFSSFERVVGNIHDSVKEIVLHETNEQFRNQNFESLIQRERQKTPEELQILSLANSVTNELRREYGLSDFDIPAENIHIITDKAWGEGKDEQGSFGLCQPEFQRILLREQLSNMVFLTIAMHELLHFKSYNVLQVIRGGKGKLGVYRSGLRIQSRDGKTFYLNGIDEAVTEELSQRLIRKFFDHPLFAKEEAQTKKILNQYPGALRAPGKTLFTPDVYYAQLKEESKGKKWLKAVGRIFGFKKVIKEEPDILCQEMAYPQERKIFNTLIDKLYEKNTDQISNREAVFNVFAKAMLTGNILPLGRLVDGTFGKGTLRRIGELDHDTQALEAFVDSLDSTVISGITSK